MNLQANMPDDPFPTETDSASSFSANQLQLYINREAGLPAELWLPDDTQLTQWVVAALSASLPQSRRDKKVEVSLSLVGTETIRQLNADYRETDRPTNVLSFPANMPDLPASETDDPALVLLGDVLVCASVLGIEAPEQGKPIENHWAHMVVHSLLHLNGLDHLDENSADAMESLEIQILSTFGIPNPYLAESAKQP